MKFVASSSEGEIQTCICSIWSDVLSIDKIGCEDGLFSLGGDSHHLMLIVSRIFRAFRVKVSVGVLPDNPTVTDFAALVRQKLLDADLAQ